MKTNACPQMMQNIETALIPLTQLKPNSSLLSLPSFLMFAEIENVVEVKTLLTPSRLFESISQERHLKCLSKETIDL